jgi:hypothetical protein
LNRRAEDFASGFVEEFLVELVSHHVWSALQDLRDVGGIWFLPITKVVPRIEKKYYALYNKCCKGFFIFEKKAEPIE